MRIARDLLARTGFQLQESPQNVDLSGDAVDGEIAFREMAGVFLAPHTLVLDAARQGHVMRHVRGVVNRVGDGGSVAVAINRIMDEELPANPVVDRPIARDLQAAVLLLDIADMYAARRANGHGEGG